MKLYVGRHGDAGAKSSDPKAERERTLTANGRKTIQAVAEAMVEADEIPSVIFCSPFQRAVDSADIYGRVFKVSVNIVGDFAPDRPLEGSLLEFMAHDELKRFMIVGHHDNTAPAFNKFGGDMDGCLADDDDVDGDTVFWPELMKGEVRRLKIHREFGFWQCRMRIRPSDLGFKDET